MQTASTTASFSFQSFCLGLLHKRQPHPAAPAAAAKLGATATSQSVTPISHISSRPLSLALVLGQECNSPNWTRSQVQGTEPKSPSAPWPLRLSSQVCACLASFTKHALSQEAPHPLCASTRLYFMQYVNPAMTCHRSWKTKTKFRDAKNTKKE